MDKLSFEQNYIYYVYIIIVCYKTHNFLPAIRGSGRARIRARINVGGKCAKKRDKHAQRASQKEAHSAVPSLSEFTSRKDYTTNSPKKR